MSDSLDLEPDPVYDSSIILDNFQLTDPILLGDKLGDTNKGVPGRLLGKSPFYAEIGATQYIVETIEHGYKLVFYCDTSPPTFSKRNNKSALLKSDFVYEEFLRLEQLGCIRRVDFVPHIVNPVSCVFFQKMAMRTGCKSRT